MSSLQLSRLHQQCLPVRYIQIQEPTRCQYNLQSQIALHQQSQHHNYPQLYSSSSLNIQPDNLINVKKCENIPVMSHFANQLSSKSTILSHNSNFKSVDERQFNRQISSGLNEIGQPKYIISNSHLISPGELSLTCFTLTNWIYQLYPTIIRTNLIPDYLQLPIPLQSVYNYYRDYPTLKFINIIEAVPDILKNNRPANFIFTSTLISVSIGRNETLSPHSGKNLINKLQRTSSNSEYSIAINPHWSVLLKATRRKKYNCDYQLEIINEQLTNNLSNYKTYAGVLQDNTKFNWDKMKMIKGMYEINSATEATCGPQKRFITSNDNDINKDEVISSSDESDELISTTAEFIARAARRTSRVSSTDSGISIDEPSNNKQSYRVTTQNGIKTVDQKCFNKLAEDFCFGPLMKSSFLVVFDEYNKSRRRMEYTKLLIEQINNEDLNNIDENSNVCITNVIEQMNNCNGEINSTVSYHQHHVNHNYYNYYNYNHNWQPQQQWKRDNNYLTRRNQNRV